MSLNGWLLLAIAALPTIGFPLWVFAQFLKARREETETVLRKGLLAEAEIIGYVPQVRGATVQYRFRAAGWENPIAVTQSLPPGSTYALGDKVAVRYLPRHPHIAVIVPSNSAS